MIEDVIDILHQRSLMGLCSPGQVGLLEWYFGILKNFVWYDWLSASERIHSSYFGPDTTIVSPSYPGRTFQLQSEFLSVLGTISDWSPFSPFVL